MVMQLRLWYGDAALAQPMVMQLRLWYGDAAPALLIVRQQRLWYGDAALLLPLVMQLRLWYGDAAPASEAASVLSVVMQPPHWHNDAAPALYRWRRSSGSVMVMELRLVTEKWFFYAGSASIFKRQSATMCNLCKCALPLFLVMQAPSVPVKMSPPPSLSYSQIWTHTEREQASFFISCSG
jgi:hypothetical protein